MDEEIRVNDLVVAPEVVETIVRLSAEKVEGVASVGQSVELKGVLSHLSQKKTEALPPAITVGVKDGKLDIAIRLTVQFDHPFVDLANRVRESIASSVSSQIGAEVSSVDVYIDTLLFPKE